MNKKIKRRVLIIMTALFLLSGSFLSYAAVKTSEGVDNSFNTGGIKIDAEVYTEFAGEIVPLKDRTVVDYYGNMSYIPRLTNKAEDCYLRVKLIAETESQSIDIIKYLKGVNKDFKYINGHLYYLFPMKNGDTVDICSSFDVPQEWDYMTSNDLKIKVIVDAVQAKNFNVDFSKKDPWGDVAILKSHMDENYDYNEMIPGDDGRIKIVCGNLSGIKINTDDFFKDVKFMPGDTYKDELTLTNNSEETETVMFKTDYKDSKLLRMMHMDIDNGQAFYSGAVSNSQLKTYQEIAKLSPGESKTIKVTLELPENADNAYQDKNDLSTWYFAIAEKPVKTGDGTLIWLFAVLCFISALVSLVLLRGSKNEDI